jgi:hypothetical protein
VKNMSRLNFSRRTLLRGLFGGAASALLLPTLEIMLNSNGTAHADGTPLPKRFCAWHFGNGVQGPRWVPEKEGTGWAPSEELKPLFDAGVGEYVSVASGFGLKLGDFPNDAHNTGRVAMTSAAIRMKSNGHPADDGPSLTEAIGDAIGGASTFKRVELGISENAVWESAQNKAVNGIMSPRDLFDTLFGDAGGDATAASKIAKARGSSIEATIADAKALQARLGKEDQQRLDKHLEMLYGVQKRLALDLSSCTLPPDPGQDPEYDSSHEDLVGKNKLMADIVRAAMACDLSRVYNIMFCKSQANTVFWQLDAKEGMHTVTHAHTSASQKLHHKSVVLTMECLGYLLEQLKDTPEGDGNLLDSLCMLAWSEQDSGESGNDHGTENIPILVIGKAGGALKGGVHYRSTSKENTTKAHMTCLRALGIDAPSFGKGAAKASETISAFEV